MSHLTRPRRGLGRLLATASASVLLLLGLTASPAHAAEAVEVTVARGSAAKLVVSPWAQNYRDTSYDNTYCSSKVNMIMRMSWSVDSVTSTSIHVNSIKMELRTLWPMVRDAGGIGDIWYVSPTSPRTEYPASTTTKTKIWNVDRTFTWSSTGRVTTTQYYRFDANGLPPLCSVGNLRSLVFHMKRG